MSLTLTHSFVSGAADGTDPSKLRPSNWNAAHVLSGATTGDLLCASSASSLTGVADVAAGSVLTSGGVGSLPAWSATPTLTALTLGTTPATSGVLRLGYAQYIKARRNTPTDGDANLIGLDTPSAGNPDCVNLGGRGEK
jgi:hypothetical protein